MVAKKTSPKHKKRFYRRIVILAALALIGIILVVFNLVQSAQKQELERQDREKFTVLEADMNKLKTQLDRSAGAGEWKLEKGCEKPGIKFYTGDAGYCRIDVKPFDDSTSASLMDIKNSITMVARVNSEGKDEVAGKDFIGFAFKGSGNECSVYFVKNIDLTLNKIKFLCGRPALQMYYPER